MFGFFLSILTSTKFWVVTYMGLGQKVCVTCGSTSSDPISVTPYQQSICHRVGSNQTSRYVSTCIISVSHCHCSWGGRGISFQRWRKWSREREELNSPGYTSWRTQANAACSILRLFLSPGNPHCLNLSLLSDRGCPDGIVAWCRSQQLSCSYLNSGEESWSVAVPQSRCVFQTVKLVHFLCKHRDLSDTVFCLVPWTRVPPHPCPGPRFQMLSSAYPLSLGPHLVLAQDQEKSPASWHCFAG